ncbi:MAG: protein kinase [Myxococcaceae bacterium]
MNGELAKTGVSESGLLKGGTEVLNGRFKVIELLGRGGMGDVYLGEQVSLGRKVALKTLRNDLSTQPGMTERFKREALLLSQVDHPSVVRVIDFGLAESTYVLVMEYVEGENLAMASRGGPFTPERAVRVLADIAEGLDAIHAKGIVHRDLKLDNVLLTQSANGERARLLDFGIARLAESEGGPGGSVTQAGLVLGTPEYISPEQATGGKIDPRSDVYAFGILAYRLLTGRHPFEGPSAREFLLQHISKEPPPITTFAPTLPEPLAKLVMSCLVKSPEGRPANGRGLLTQLTAQFTPVTPLALTPAPSASTTVQRPPPTGEAVRKTGGTSLLRIAVPGAIALALAIFFIPKLFSDPAIEKAGVLLDQGKPAAALEAIDASKNRNDGALRMLRAEALHQQNKHADEWYLLSQSPDDALEQMRPALLAALLTDFPKNDDDDGLKSALQKLPKSKLKDVREWASGKWSAAQWGALRWADTSQLKGADLVKGYINVLDSDDCDARSTAARRLGELGDNDAIDPLKKLLKTPRKAMLGGFLVRGCGHDEASAALRKLGATPDDR